MTYYDISIVGDDRRSLTYWVNGKPISTLLRDVHRHIRSRVAVPSKLIKKACLKAKEHECESRISFHGLDGWKVRRK